MNTDSAVLLVIAELRQQLAAVEAENIRLRSALAEHQGNPPPAGMPTWDRTGPTGETTK